MVSDYDVLDAEGGRRPAPIWSLRDLNELTIEKWRAWLLRGIITWSRTEIGSAERISAFAPLAIDHNDCDGPGQLAAALKKIRLSPATEVRLNQALAGAIETWLPSDTISSAVFLLQLAGHVAWSVSPEPQMRVLLSRGLYISEEERTDFARAIAFAATQRLTSEEVRRIAQRLRKLELDTPDALIEMVSRLAVEDSASLISDIEAMLPEVRDMPRDDPLMETFSDLLVDRLGMEQALRVAYSDATTTHKFLQQILRHRVTSAADGQTLLWDEMVFRDIYTNEVVRIEFAPDNIWVKVQRVFKVFRVEDRVFKPQQATREI